MLTESKKAFIEFMMSADVLRFGSFVTKSGRNTPYFVNTGNYKTGEQIAKLGKFYAALVKETVGEDFTAMFGPAYKGIPLATAAAAALYNEYGISKRRARSIAEGRHLWQIHSRNDQYRLQGHSRRDEAEKLAQVSLRIRQWNRRYARFWNRRQRPSCGTRRPPACCRESERTD